MASGDTNIWIGDDSTTVDDPTTAASWSLGTAPADGEHGVVPADVDESNAIGAGDISPGGTGTGTRLASLTIEEGYDLTVGDPDAADMDDKYLVVDAESVTLGGTGESYLECYHADRILVVKAGSAAGDGQQMLYLRGDGNSRLDIQASSGQKIGLAGLPGEAAEFAEIHITGGDVYIGPGVSVSGSLNVYGGVVENAADVATINVLGGVLDNLGDCSTALIVRGGTAYYRGIGTTAAVTVAADGSLDLSLDSRSRTFTNTTLYQGATFRDPWTSVAYTNDLQLNQCGISDVTLELGDHIELTPVKIT